MPSLMANGQHTCVNGVNLSPPKYAELLTKGLLGKNLKIHDKIKSDFKLSRI